MSRFGIALLVMTAAMASCKSGGPAGTYSLDKVAMQKSLDDKIATMPDERKAMGRLAKEMVKSMEIRLTLKGDGKGEMVTTMPSLKAGEKGSTKTDVLTWEKQGESVVISDGRKPVTCSFKADRLVCSDGNQELVFLKG